MRISLVRRAWWLAGCWNVQTKAPVAVGPRPPAAPDPMPGGRPCQLPITGTMSRSSRVSAATEAINGHLARRTGPRRCRGRRGTAEWSRRADPRTTSIDGVEVVGQPHLAVDLDLMRLATRTSSVQTGSSASWAAAPWAEPALAGELARQPRHRTARRRSSRPASTNGAGTPPMPRPASWRPGRTSSRDRSRTTSRHRRTQRFRAPIASAQSAVRRAHGNLLDSLARTTHGCASVSSLAASAQHAAVGRKISRTSDRSD